MKKTILAALVAALSTSTAGATEIMWRSPTAGVLEVTAAPSTPDDDPAEPSSPAGNFGIFYGLTTKVRVGTYLAIQPLSQTGFPGTGYSYVSSGLPAGVALNPSTGMITGRIMAAGTYSLPITIQRDGKADTVTAKINVG